MSYRDNCAICGESYNEDNLIDCHACGRSFCYRCGDSGNSICRYCLESQRTLEQQKHKPEHQSDTPTDFSDDAK